MVGHSGNKSNNKYHLLKEARIFNFLKPEAVKLLARKCSGIIGAPVENNR